MDQLAIYFGRQTSFPCVCVSVSVRNVCNSFELNYFDGVPKERDPQRVDDLGDEQDGPQRNVGSS